MLNPKKEPRNLCDILDELLDSMGAAAEEAEAARAEEELAEKQAQYEEAAVSLRMIYDSFVEVGFTTEQAFRLVLTLIGGKK